MAGWKDLNQFAELMSVASNSSANDLAAGQKRHVVHYRDDQHHVNVDRPEEDDECFSPSYSHHQYDCPSSTTTGGEIEADDEAVDCRKHTCSREWNCSRHVSCHGCSESRMNVANPAIKNLQLTFTEKKKNRRLQSKTMDAFTISTESKCSDNRDEDEMADLSASCRTTGRIPNHRNRKLSTVERGIVDNHGIEVVQRSSDEEFRRIKAETSCSSHLLTTSWEAAFNTNTCSAVASDIVSRSCIGQTFAPQMQEQVNFTPSVRKLRSRLSSHYHQGTSSSTMHSPLSTSLVDRSQKEFEEFGDNVVDEDALNMTELQEELSTRHSRNDQQLLCRSFSRPRGDMLIELLAQKLDRFHQNHLASDASKRALPTARSFQENALTAFMRRSSNSGGLMPLAKTSSIDSSTSSTFSDLSGCVMSGGTSSQSSATSSPRSPSLRSKRATRAKGEARLGRQVLDNYAGLALRSGRNAAHHRNASEGNNLEAVEMLRQPPVKHKIGGIWRCLSCGRKWEVSLECFTEAKGEFLCPCTETSTSTGTNPATLILSTSSSATSLGSSSGSVGKLDGQRLPSSPLGKVKRQGGGRRMKQGLLADSSPASFPVMKLLSSHAEHLHARHGYSSSADLTNTLSLPSPQRRESGKLLEDMLAKTCSVSLCSFEGECGDACDESHGRGSVANSLKLESPGNVKGLSSTAMLRKTCSYEETANYVINESMFKAPFLDHKSFVLQKPYRDVSLHYKLAKGNIGEGSFGVIKRCVEKSSNTVYACKILRKVNFKDRNDAEQVQREVEFLRLVRGQRNIIEMYDVLEDSENIYIVMELCEGGDLFDRLKVRRQFSEANAAKVCLAVVDALEHCHNMGIIHRDVKPENVLMCDHESDCSIKLIDFGIASFIRPGGDAQRFIPGTPVYMAPESFDGRFGPESDVWGVGVLMYILLSGVQPFWETEKYTLEQAIKKKAVSFRYFVWDRASEEAKDLIHRMLEKKPDRRITVAGIRDHPWVRKWTS